MVTEQETVTEGKDLCDYELVLVISPEIEDDLVNATLEKVHRFINEKGGIISSVEQWGKKQLAYSIRQSMEGNYVLTRFKFKPALSKDLEANLGISEEILRHLLIKL